MKEMKEELQYSYNDGGRSKYFKGNAGDCVVRALALFTSSDYKEMYNSLKDFNIKLKPFKRKTKKHLAFIERINNESSPRTGIFLEVLKLFIEQKGYNCSHTKEPRKLNTFKKGTYLIKIRKHIITIKNGVLYDTWDSRKRPAGTNGIDHWDEVYRTATQWWKLN